MGWFIPWLLLHFLLAAAGTGLARRYALSRQLLDQPGERRSHAVATPRGGGIAIVLVLLLATVLLAIRMPASRELLLAFGASLGLVAGIGWWDDHRPLSPLGRLLVHLLAALIFALALYRATHHGWQAVLAVAAILALVNVWNFMDGIDGLATSQALIAAIPMAFVLPGPWAWLAAALFAACCGFLPFNFPRARIFLGDVGSGALGFALAALLACAPGVTPAASSAPWWLLLLPMAAFLVDASFTLASRMLSGERWWKPHVSHLYQRAARRHGHLAVTLAYAAFSGVTLLLMWKLSNVAPGSSLAGIVACYATAFVVWGTLRKGLA